MKPRGLPLLLLSSALVLSACGASEPAPEDTVKAFFSESWDEGETAEDYLSEVEPLLTAEAFEDSQELSNVVADGPATIEYSAVTIDDVDRQSENAAQVTVSYKVTYSYHDKVEDEEQTDTLSLVKEDGKWLIAE